MAERSTSELIERLASGDAMDRVFAAEELGENGDRAAVRPLVAALTGLAYDTRADFSVATAVIEALANLGAGEAADAIVDALQKTRDDDVVPEVACGALVRLRATGSVPRLQELLRQIEPGYTAREIEQVITVLSADSALR